MVLLSNYPGIILYKQISLAMEQLNKCICKVFKKDDGFGTGFFCFINYQNKKFPALIVNNHLINEEFIKNNKTIFLELNNEKKKININDNRIIYTNKNFNVTIIEINPDKDFIYNFLELDENIFKEGEEIFYKQSIYTLQCEKRVSFGIIKGIEDYKINHLCSTDRDSGGSPIMNISNGKVIGIHVGSINNRNCNFGTFLKYPIKEFIEKYGNYILFKEQINSKTYSIASNSIISDNETKILDLENKNKILEKSLNSEIEKNKILQVKITQLQQLLNNNQNNNIHFDRGNSSDFLTAILKKDKEIEDLKLKLSRFPFELAQGEQLMSIIFVSTDQKVHYSAICKNTSIFGNIELQLYNAYPDYSDSVNIFTVNGNRISRNKSLYENKIKNNDIILLNKIDY